MLNQSKYRDLGEDELMTPALAVFSQMASSSFLVQTQIKSYVSVCIEIIYFFCLILIRTGDL